MSKAVRIPPVFVNRVWGRKDLAPYFGVREQAVGEVWFPAGEKFPLLAKFIFTDERLSVQVHPDDAYAALHEKSRGKTEMWHILEARAGATIALGFNRDVSKEQVRASVDNGSIVDLLNWIPVHAGDTFFAKAGVVHAIGAGITLCEIQQNSDVTYRLFDYGRPRELHLERALDVSLLSPVEGLCDLPVVCGHFTTEMLCGGEPQISNLSGSYLLIALAGSGTIDGQSLRPGDAWLVRPAAGPVTIDAAPGARLLRSGCAA